MRAVWLLCSIVTVAGCASEDRPYDATMAVTDSGDPAPVIGSDTSLTVTDEAGQDGGAGVSASWVGADAVWMRIQEVIIGQAGASEALFDVLRSADSGLLRSSRYEIIPADEAEWYPEAALWLSDVFMVSGRRVRLEPEGLRALDRWVLEQARRRDSVSVVRALDALDQLLAGLMIETSMLTGVTFQGEPYLYLASSAWRMQVLSRMIECGPLGEAIARPKYDRLTLIRRGERGIEDVP